VNLIPYCLNIHPGESLAAVRDAVERHALAVKARVSPAGAYPVGLRLSAAAADELTSDRATLEAFAELLRRHDLFATGINGFPYGAFHNTAVKTEVYRPDWTTPERLSYTARLASVLAALLPEGATGNISTVPLGYKAPGSVGDEQRATVFVRQLAVMAEFLHELSVNEGREIVLALEPEPDCLLENTDDVIAWFEDELLHKGIPWLSQNGRRTHDEAEALLRRYVGLCLDTCHFAVAFEDPLTALVRFESACIRVARIQLSAAVKATVSDEALTRLSAFIDRVYLHQTKIRQPRGRILSLPDLTAETLATAREQQGCELRTHFHVPLFFDGDGTLSSTNDELTPEFFAHVREANYALETETYTFDVLPPEIRSGTVVDSLAREHAWVQERLG